MRKNKTNFFILSLSTVVLTSVVSIGCTKNVAEEKPETPKKSPKTETQLTKDYEKLNSPIVNAQLFELLLLKHKDENSISLAYKNLLDNLLKAKNLVTLKSQGLNEIDSVFKSLNEAIDEIAKKYALVKKDIIKPLEVLINSLQIIYDRFKNSTNEQIKLKAKELETKLSEAKEYLKTDYPEKEQIDKLIDDLNKIKEELTNLTPKNPTLSNMPVNIPPKKNPLVDVNKNPNSKILNAENLKKLFENFHSKIQITGVETKKVLPSAIKPANIKIKDEFNLNGLNVNFNLASNDLFGRLSVSATVDQNGLKASAPLLVLEDKFKQDDSKVKALNKNLFAEMQSILQMPISMVKEYASPIQSIRISIERISDGSLGESDINDILSDKVATLMYLIGRNASNSSQKKSDVRTNFLNKQESTNFSKLNYLSKASYKTDISHGINDRWEYIRRLVFLNNIAKRDDIKNDTSLSLVTLFSDASVEKFVVDFFKDYIEKYYNETIVPKAEFSLLYEFIQPFRTLELFFMLKDKLDETTKVKTIKVLNKFSSSFTQYGTRQGTTYNGTKKDIDDSFHTVNALSVINYLTLENQNENKIIEDFEEYKTWIKNSNFLKIRGSILITSFFKVLRGNNEYYKELSKSFPKVKVEDIDFSKVVSFLDNYLKSSGSFNNVNAVSGATSIMEGIAEMYSVLDIKPEQQKQALDIIKTKLISGRNSSDFTYYEDLPASYKAIWDKFFK